MGDEAYGEPFIVEVERGKIREFARATKARDPRYLEDPRPVAPPTFLASAALWAGPDAVPPGLVRNWSRILHGEQEYVFHGPPPRAGQRLTARQHIADSYTKQGRRGGEMRFTVLVTEFHDEDGTLVAEARSTVIETSRAAGEES